MRRRDFIVFAAAAAIGLNWPLGALAQEAGRIKRVGFLRVGLPPSAWIEALREGLRELGYVEGRDIAIEFALAASAAELPERAGALVGLKVDVIFASGTPPLLAARDMAGVIPVVFVAAVDPVATGLVASLARPGGNVTGLTNTQADITGKQVQLLRELRPGLSRLAVIVRAGSEAGARYVEEAVVAAGALGIQIITLALRDSAGLEELFIAAQGASAALMTDDSLFTAHRAEIAQLAQRYRLPLIFSNSEFVHSGGLMSYGPSTADLYRRAASYLDKILKGTRPSDLPVEQPTKFELVINLKAAKALDLVIPPILLARADHVID